MNNDQMMKDILLSAKTIASVGLSSNRAKESYGIVEYLKDRVIALSLSTQLRAKSSAKSLILI